MGQHIEDDEMPHHLVYARLGVSKIPDAGIGVIAIIDIPKDAYVFWPDDDQMIWVNEDQLTFLPEPLLKMYTDFCVKKGTKYGCPVNFNKLTPAWYLNNSEDPNVYADEHYRFRAARDIKAGEELTSKYSTYSDDPSE
jgi:SET domain